MLFMTRSKKINIQKINSNKKDALGVFLKTEEGEHMYLQKGEAGVQASRLTLASLLSTRSPNPSPGKGALARVIQAL